MPTYEYACASCGHELEANQKISDAPLKTCPKCNTESLERLVSRASFVLKGSGWYSDGYGSKAENKADKSKATSTPAASGADGSSSSSGAEAKSADSGAASSAKAEPQKATAGDGGASHAKKGPVES